MTTQQTKVQYVADGISTEFQTPFATFLEEGLEVFVNDRKVTDSVYKVYLDEEKRGTIIFAEAPLASSLITISRNLPVERRSQFQEGGALRANTLNYEFDYQMACIQDLQEEVGRAMTYPPYLATEGINLNLPAPEAGKSIVWNAEGTNLENSNILLNDLEETLREYKETAEASVATAVEAASVASQKAELAIAGTDGKANITLDNLNDEGKAKFGISKLITSYQDGYTWYKIYEETHENGELKYWAEQGGLKYNVSPGGIEFSYFVPYIEAPHVVATPFHEDSTFSGSFQIRSISTSRLALKNTNGITTKAFWIARGYCNAPT